MKRTNRKGRPAGRFPLGRTLLLFFVCAWVHLALPPATPAEDAPAWAEEESLVPLIAQRLGEVQVEGVLLSALYGQRVEDIRVFALREERLEPIAFQIDERDQKGRIVLAQSAQPARDPDPFFDENDLLLFMARDLGAMVYAPQTGKGESFSLSLKVTDPRDGSAGWAYVLCSPTPPPPSPEICVRYTRRQGQFDQVDTPYYSMVHPWGAFSARAWYLHTPSGTAGADLLDRFRARGVYRSFLPWFRLRIGEEQLETSLVGVRAGPIRVVRRIEYGADPGFGIRSSRFVADSYYYEAHLSGVLANRLPVRLEPLFSLSEAEIGLGYSRRAWGMMFRNSRNPEGVVIDGRMSPQELGLDPGPDEWRLLTGEQGTVFRESLPDGGKAPGAEAALVYEDDVRARAGRRGEIGPAGCVGERVEAIRLDSGVFKADADYLVPPEYRPGDERTYLQWRRAPLRVEVEVPDF